MNKLDKVFIEKFSDHSTTPSSAVWDRIDAKLSKKNNGIAWMRWAAVIAPGAVAAALWLNKPAETQLVAQVTPQKEVAAVVSTPPGPQQPLVKPNPIKAKPVVKVVTKNIQEPTPVVALEPEPELAIQPETIVIEDVAIEPTVTTTEAPAEVSEAPKPIVLVYTLESVATAVPSEEKTTSFERVVEFARTVKHSDPIGDFRVMKDEFLALDLRKKSTKKN